MTNLFHTLTTLLAQIGYILDKSESATQEQLKEFREL